MRAMSIGVKIHDVAVRNLLIYEVSYLLRSNDVILALQNESMRSNMKQIGAII